MKYVVILVLLLGSTAPVMAGSLDGKGLICHKFELSMSLDLENRTSYHKRKNYSVGYWFVDGMVHQYNIWSGGDDVTSRSYEYNEISRHEVLLLTDNLLFGHKILDRRILQISEQGSSNLPFYFHEKCSLVNAEQRIVDILNSVIAKQKSENKI